ncbi:MAG TPA: sugar phosphate nucleotidyltransferase [Candidatus Dormibacteraeota bacterium]|nr:sugar phosphate nucleotidyltransferase [Candidatus Dormibacteraeota bacterium]
MKRRFSMTLDPSLMHKIDILVDGTRFTNRSQTAEFLLKLGMEQFRPERTALILCGGLEPRVRPSTFSTPKALLPIGYRPLLEYQIEYVKQFEFDRIILAIGFLQEQIVRYLDEHKLGVRLRYSFEKQPLDTGGAIKNAELMLSSDFLTLNGDVIFSGLDLNKLIYEHKKSESLATIVLARSRTPTRFGAVELDSDNRVVSFIEKPRKQTEEEAWVNAGVYLIRPSVLGKIRKGARASLELDVFPRLMREGKISGYKHEGYWADVGTPEDYLRVQRDLLTGVFKPQEGFSLP